ncbi:MAG: glycosyltransferase family 4 protein [Verrucomicrobiota bacterium]
MRILVSSHVFSPSIGGIESISAMLAEAFVKLQHEVTLITQTPDDRPAALQYPYTVIRQPGNSELKQLLRACDVFWQNNISLKSLGPALLAGAPTVVTHQTWLTRTDGTTGWQDVLKKLASHKVTNVAISRAIAEAVPGESTIIGNPYRGELFQRDEAIAKDRDVVFLGRLVSDKGADLLLEALGGLEATCTIIGDGPERAALEEQAQGKDVVFTGALSGPALAAELNRHKLMVVSSRWREPFGIVALEGMACGCVPIVADGGGLVDAVGPAGVSLPRGDADALRQSLSDLLDKDTRCEEIRAQAPAHLAKFTAEAIAQQYLKLFAQAAR